MTANDQLTNDNDAAKNAAADPALLYFTDPMCSWCWGFSPVITALQNHYGESLPIEVVAGGLRGPHTPPMTSEQRNEIHGHWRHVEKLTEQPFQYSASLPDGFVYNSEPACRALVAGRRLAPGRTLQWLNYLQQAFYADGIDISKTSELCRLARQFGLTGFADVFDSAKNRELTAADFDRRYESAVTGFPSLLLRRDDRLKLICQGYAPFDEIIERLTDAV